MTKTFSPVFSPPGLAGAADEAVNVEAEDGEELLEELLQAASTAEAHSSTTGP